MLKENVRNSFHPPSEPFLSPLRTYLELLFLHVVLSSRFCHENQSIPISSLTTIEAERNTRCIKIKNPEVGGDDGSFFEDTVWNECIACSSTNRDTIFLRFVHLSAATAVDRFFYQCKCHSRLTEPCFLLRTLCEVGVLLYPWQLSRPVATTEAAALSSTSLPCSVQSLPFKRGCEAPPHLECIHITHPLCRTPHRNKDILLLSIFA